MASCFWSQLKRDPLQIGGQTVRPSALWASTSRRSVRSSPSRGPRTWSRPKDVEKGEELQHKTELVAMHMKYQDQLKHVSFLLLFSTYIIIYIY